MNRIAFDNQKYIQLQTENIAKRVEKFGDKLYLEFGGKLFDDYHASRVLPGFEPDGKMKMLLSMKDDVEMLIAINANDIEKGKIRGDIGITYDQDVLRLIDAFQAIGLYVSHVVITQYSHQKKADQFSDKLKSLGIKSAFHYPIEGYPSNISKIISEEGFGQNDYIETTRKIVVVTAPGPGSGKLATCLSQLYLDSLHGIKAGYAKFETFPIWNLPLRHPVNLAYEAATADLNDVNMIDPFHLEAYGVTTVNYNRDVDAFPVLNAILAKIQGQSPYKSPTDMGVNMIGFCISDDQAAIDASYNEIICRYYNSLVNQLNAGKPLPEVEKIERIMSVANISTFQRACIQAAKDKEQATGTPSVALQLNDGRIITGKTTNLLTPGAACILNCLKALADIDDAELLIAKEVIEPICTMKVEKLGNHNPRLHIDEVLIALTISATNNPTSMKAYEQLSKLANTQAHSTTVLSNGDLSTLKKLHITCTCEPKYRTQKLFHAK